MRHAFVCLLAAAFPALAQSEDLGAAAPELESAPEPWRLSLEPAAWYAALSGTVKMPGSEDELELTDLNLDSPRLAPALEVHVREGRWRFVARGQYTDSDRETSAPFDSGFGGLSISAGDTLSSEIEYASVELVASYRVAGIGDDGVFQRDISGPRERLDVGVDVIGGLRAMYTSLRVENLDAAPGDVSVIAEDELFLYPVVGVRLDMRFNERINIDVGTTVGGMAWDDQTSFAWNIVIGLSVEIAWNAAVQIGYRNTYFLLDSGEFEWAGGAAGVYGGVRVEF